MCRGCRNEGGPQKHGRSIGPVGGVASGKLQSMRRVGRREKEQKVFILRAYPPWPARKAVSTGAQKLKTSLESSALMFNFPQFVIRFLVRPRLRSRRSLSDTGLLDDGSPCEMPPVRQVAVVHRVDVQPYRYSSTAWRRNTGDKL